MYCAKVNFTDKVLLVSEQLEDVLAVVIEFHHEFGGAVTIYNNRTPMFLAEQTAGSETIIILI
jgi:hypothetical protein